MASAPSVTPDAIFQLAQGFMASKLLFTAGEIDLFAQLADGPKSQADLAAGLELPVRSVGVVANAMVALGMLTFENGRYGNTEVAQVFLTGRGPDMRPLVRFWNRLFLTNTSGISYSAAEVREWGAATGWRFVDQRPLAGPVSLLVLEK